MNSKSLILGLTVTLTSICSTTAFSQSRTEQAPPEKGQREQPKFSDLLAKMDKNKDGKLAESEVDGPLKKDFKRVDANKDGFITKEEFEKAPPPPRQGEKPKEGKR